MEEKRRHTTKKEGYACEQLHVNNWRNRVNNNNTNRFQANIRRKHHTVSNNSERHQFSTNGYSTSNDHQRPNDRRNNRKTFHTSNNFSGKQRSNNQELGFSGNCNLNAETYATNSTKSVKTTRMLEQQEHYIGRCQQLNKFYEARRNPKVNKHSLCFNCLSPS